MEREVLRYVPPYWSKNQIDATYNLLRNSNEFEEIEHFFIGYSISKIERVENLNKYGQFLVRQQHLLALNPTVDFYQVRKFVVLNESNKDNALKYYMDVRRCHGELFVFNSVVPRVSYGSVVFVINVVTNNPNSSDFTPSRDCDFYIEYIVYVA